MKIMDKMDRKFQGKGIPNLSVYVVICYILGYILELIAPQIIDLLSLNVRQIMHGQVWRVITWIISPPQDNSVFFFIIAILFFYLPIGMSLERIWGSFRYTVYIFGGIIFTVIGAFIVYFIFPHIYGIPYPFGGRFYSTYYISLSIFLAYAFTMPDQHLLLYFIIPIKMRWMAYVYIALVGYQIFTDIRNGFWFLIVPIVASLLNFVLFYFLNKDMSSYSPKERKRRADFKKAMAPASRAAAPNGITKHKCAICGRTEVSDPDMEFRFCTRCNGYYEYCNEHLFTHEHKK